MDSNIKTNMNGVIRSGNYSCIMKPRTLKAYGEKYEIPVKTADFSEKLKAVTDAIANSSAISDIVREVRNGIMLFIGDEETERIFPDENLRQIDIEEITSFWQTLNDELVRSQDDILSQYQSSGSDQLMVSNLLFGTLPDSYEYGGKIYEMRTDFREWIKFDLLITDEDIPMADKLPRLMEMVFPVIPPDVMLWDFVMWFYYCGKSRQESSGKGGGGKKQSAVYSFRHDSHYIYAAFMEVYGIDLTDIPYLHWWKFKALFDSLHNCKFTDIMGYRAENITSKTPDYMKQFLTKMKKLYALPRSLSEQQKINEMKRLKEKMGY